MLKCPTVMVEGDPVVESYSVSPLQQMLANSKRFHPKKRWSKTVLLMLLDQHIQCANGFSTGEQSISWMEAKTHEHKGKFQADQRNWKVPQKKRNRKRQQN